MAIILMIGMVNEMKVIGFRKFDYTSKKTGKTYPACNIYVTYPLSKGEGCGCESVFVPFEVLGDYQPLIGDEVQILYNRFGGVQSVAPASEAGF